jgi:hypothetical protein
MGRAFLLGLAVLLAGCAPVVDGKFSDIEVTRPDISIPALTVATQPSVTFTFTIDSNPFGASSNPEAQDGIVAVKLHRLALTAKSGITDLSFIESLHALACVPISKNTTQSVRQVELADYERRFDVPVGTTFEVPIAEPIDLLPLLRPSSTEPRRILVIVNLGGQLPTSEWKADVTMSLSLEIRQ